MNIIEKTDEEILAVANPFWNDLVKYSSFPTKTYQKSLLSEISTSHYRQLSDTKVASPSCTHR
jgi:hypothetical protein